MAVDPVQLVKDDLAIAIALDATLEAIIAPRVEATIALQGWEGVVISNQQKAYVAILTTKALLPRVISKFARMVQEAKGGPAEAKFVDAIEAMKLLQTELKDAVKLAAKNVDPADAVEDATQLPNYPTTGMAGF
jgi:hypothetical protein